MKTYIVTLKKDINYNQFWSEIEFPTTGLAHVPDRPVQIIYDRTPFKRICEYALSDEEAEKLANDPRVESVEIPVRDNPLVSVCSTRIQNIAQTGMNYTKPASLIYNNSNKASINWGLIRHSYRNNAYGTSYTTSADLNYVVDGTDVDVVINDSGLQIDHPEFTDYQGVSRVKYVNWDSYTRPGANLTSRSYQDTLGHGTLCGGVSCGKNYGWAKNANIYPLYWSTDGGGPGEPLDSFESLLNWHNSKTSGNPTIVNMSWELRLNLPQGTEYYAGLSGGNYRGTSWSGPQTDSFYQSRGLIPLLQGIPLQYSSNPIFPYTSAAYNAALAELIDSGIIVVQAAGNNRFKRDLPNELGGTGDYDNYATSYYIPGLLYYNRGASPSDPRSIVVGALDVGVTSFAQDVKAEYSSTGPGVDIYAAGTNIVGPCSNTSVGPDAFPSNVIGPYVLNTNFNTIIYSGTSFAAPQITGICAGYLQKNRSATPAQVKFWLKNNATTGTMYSPGTPTSYTDYRSLCGGAPLVAYQPLQGNTIVKNNNWSSVANVFVKTNSTTWKPVKNILIKTDSNTWKPVY